jgi:pSer/pThr/pTyr-binding forkhead associated (FHA) protein
MGKDAKLVAPTMSDNPVELAKVIWHDPENGAAQEFVLYEGVIATIGRSQDNHIHIPERTVSRHHATIEYRSGVFVLRDEGSANGVFVNEQRINGEYPLIHGDVVRLFGPTLTFEAILADLDAAYATQAPDTREKTAEAPLPAEMMYPYLSIASGDRMGDRIPIDKDEITFGRLISNAKWDVPLPDHAVSRPHARIFSQDEDWFVEDLGSSNGTMVGGNFISRPIRLDDETIITMGETTIIFHNKPQQ